MKIRLKQINHEYGEFKKLHIPPPYGHAYLSERARSAEKNFGSGDIIITTPPHNFRREAPEKFLYRKSFIKKFFYNYPPLDFWQKSGKGGVVIVISPDTEIYRKMGHHQGTYGFQIRLKCVAPREGGR